MSWAQLTAIRKQASDDRREAQGRPPISCPIDGHVLDIRSDGVRNCPQGNYYWVG